MSSVTQKLVSSGIFQRTRREYDPSLEFSTLYPAFSILLSFHTTEENEMGQPTKLFKPVQRFKLPLNPHILALNQTSTEPPSPELEYFLKLEVFIKAIKFWNIIRPFWSWTSSPSDYTHITESEPKEIGQIKRQRPTH